MSCAPAISRHMSAADGGYNEHGREIFDEEVAEASKASSSRSKKVGWFVTSSTIDVDFNVCLPFVRARLDRCRSHRAI